MRDLKAILAAAAVPDCLPNQRFGLWEIWRTDLAKQPAGLLPFFKFTAHTIQASRLTVTFLSRHTFATMMQARGETVMDDSPMELARHFPLWREASGRVLLSGLGLGCTLRGLLAIPEVEHVDVVELDPLILKIIGPEFASSERITLHQGDARSYRGFARFRWDYAWHDCWTDEDEQGSLHVLHAELLVRFAPYVRCCQGAWGFPRSVKRIFPGRLLGARRRPNRNDERRGEKRAWDLTIPAIGSTVVLGRTAPTLPDCGIYGVVRDSVSLEALSLAFPPSPARQE